MNIIFYTHALIMQARAAVLGAERGLSARPRRESECWSSCTRLAALFLCISRESHPITRLLVARKDWNDDCSPTAAGKLLTCPAADVLHFCGTVMEGIKMLCGCPCHVILRDWRWRLRATSGLLGNHGTWRQTDWRYYGEGLQLNIHEPSARLLDGSDATSVTTT